MKNLDPFCANPQCPLHAVSVRDMESGVAAFVSFELGKKPARHERDLIGGGTAYFCGVCDEAIREAANQLYSQFMSKLTH